MSTALRAAIMLFIGIAIFVGLPFLGWGVNDAPGFIGHPARFAYAVLAILLQVIAVIRFPGLGRGRGEGKKVVERQRLAVVLMQALSLAIVIGAPYSDRRDLAVLSEAEIVRYSGLIMFSLGFTTMNWAEASLGKQFSVQVSIQEGHRLVTDGLYRYLHHPRYLGIIIFFTGISLIFSSWLALILVAAMVLVLLWRIHDEESLMRHEFGADWETYSRRSWRLIPFLY